MQDLVAKSLDAGMVERFREGGKDALKDLPVEQSVEVQYLEGGRTDGVSA
jgi:hypothetical protein